MIYENIKKIVSRHSKNIVVLWSIFAIFQITFFFKYIQYNTELQFIGEQIVTLSDINTEAISVLYYNSQKNISSEIDYSKTLLNRWLDSERVAFSKVIPTIIPEINYLDDLGKLFFAPENLNDKTKQVQNFQNLSDQLELIKRVAINHHKDTLMTKVLDIIPFFILGIILILIFLTILITRNLQKTLVVKNEFILEDIWNELQGIELHQPSTIEVHPITEQAISPNEDFKKIHIESQQLIAQIFQTRDELLSKMKHLSEQNQHKPQIVSQPVLENSVNKEIQEHISQKINLVQKMLSRLFARAERSSVLAKAASDNGFQAGILALNISIEAARAGENGKSFVPISDRVKDFGEKSSHIGNAILEELQDADLSIRKAYALGKSILEDIGTTITPSSVTTSTEISNIDSSHTYETISKEQLQYIEHSFNNMIKAVEYIQEVTREMEDKKSYEITPVKNTNNFEYTLFLQETLIRNFERLYRLNYGIDPPEIDNFRN